MNIFIYDNTFEGLLSSVFYAFDTKIFPHKIVGNGSIQNDLFAEKYTIYTNTEQAKRVWTGLQKKTSKLICQKIYRCFLSELEEMPTLLFKYIQLCFNSTSTSFDTDYSNPIVLELNNIYKKVCMEGHRALMFIRFQKTSDGIYFAPFEPAFNVLPLVTKHFKQRLPDQQWIIYDTMRNYGFHYDLHEVKKIQLHPEMVNLISGKINKAITDENELDYQELWNDYFNTVNIKERKNDKVHKQFLPKRFWKYLPEKNYSFYHEEITEKK